MTAKEFEAWLKEIGAKKHLSNIINPYSDYFYQLKVKDDIGICYFIEFYHYASDKHLYAPESWTLEVSIGNRRYSIYNVDEYESEIYPGCLAEVFGIWKTLGSPYYERKE